MGTSVPVGILFSIYPMVFNRNKYSRGRFKTNTKKINLLKVQIISVDKEKSVKIIKKIQMGNYRLI